MYSGKSIIWQLCFQKMSSLQTSCWCIFVLIYSNGIPWNPEYKDGVERSIFHLLELRIIHKEVHFSGLCGEVQPWWLPPLCFFFFPWFSVYWKGITWAVQKHTKAYKIFILYDLILMAASIFIRVQFMLWQYGE